MKLRETQSSGETLERFTLTVLVLLAALPSASNVAMLAEHFGADNGRIAALKKASKTLVSLACGTGR